MIPTEDSKALVRLLAFALAGDYEQADELIRWAYKNGDGLKAVGGDIAAPNNQDHINYNAVMEIWNRTMTRNVPKVTKMTSSRKEKVRLRLGEMGGCQVDVSMFLAELFKKINESDFCNGATGWVATFDWFFSNDKNWTKVMEGNYDNRRGKSDLEKMKDEIAKADAYYEQRYGKPAGPGGNPAGRGGYGPDEQ